MKNKILTFAVVIVLVMMTGTTHAILIDQNYSLVYDIDQNITWYDFAFNPSFDDWPVTENWANNLTYLGYDDWRAPTLEELQYLGAEFKEMGTYSNGPFVNVGLGGEFYLSSDVTGADQRWAHSLKQDRTFATWPVASIYGVVVRDGETPVAVPEPATLILVGMGMAGFAITRFRRKSKS